MFNLKKYLILSVILHFFSCFLYSQGELNEVKSQIEIWERQMEYLSIDSARENSVTRAWYLHSTYLRLNEGLQYQIELLSNLNFEEEGVNERGTNGRILQDYVISKASSRAYLTELNQLAKFSKLNNSELQNSFELTTDRSLREYHHRLLKVYMKENGFQKAGQEHFRSAFRDLIGEVERETKKRGFFPDTKEGIPNFTKKYAERFKNIEVLNRSAKLEAKHFVDASPLFLEARREAIAALENVRKIDQSLGVQESNLPGLRDLLLDETVKERIDAFEIGLDQTQKRTKLKRYYDVNTKVLADKISAALAAEIEWFYINQKHEVALMGHSKRGPPDTPPPSASLSTDPLPPKKPSGGSGGILLDDLLGYKDLEKIQKRAEKSFEQVFEFETERFKAYNLNNPNWDNVKNSFIRVKPRYSGNKTDFGSHIKGLVSEYYRVMPLDPVRSTVIDAEIQETLKQYSKGPGIARSAFLGNDLTTINQIQEDLKAGIRAREIELATNKLSPPWRKKEIDVLKEGLREVKGAKLKAELNLNNRLREVKAYGDLFDRPPPDVSDWLRSNVPDFEDLNNEKFALQVEAARRRSLEKLQAIYGHDLPPSAIEHLTKIKETQAVNEATKVLATYQEYAPYASKLKPIEKAIQQPGLESSEKIKSALAMFEDAFLDIKAKENALHARLDRLFKDLQNPELRSRIPSELYERTVKAKKSLPQDIEVKTLIDPEIENWRPNQDLKKMKDMKFSKDPGGIWLTPSGIPIRKVELAEQNWKVISENTSCPFDIVAEWKLEDGLASKICFPSKSEKDIPSNNWINRLEPWF